MGFSTIDYALGALLVVVAFFSVLCSFTTIYLIQRIGRWNGYIVIILSLTICQIIYDSSFFFFIGINNPVISDLIQFTTSFGGLSVTLWTNVLSGIVLYIVTQHRSVDIWKHYWKFAILCIVPPLGYAVAFITEGKPELFQYVYNILRLASVLFNIVVYLLITRKLIAMKAITSEAVVPLRELSARLKYYPICQVITRLPACLYQFIYGFGTSSYLNSSMSTSEVIALVFYALFVPSAGIGYFLVFLHMQPQAYSTLKGTCRHACRTLCCLKTAASMKPSADVGKRPHPHRPHTTGSECSEESLLTGLRDDDAIVTDDGADDGVVKMVLSRSGTFTSPVPSRQTSLRTLLLSEHDHESSDLTQAGAGAGAGVGGVAVRSRTTSAAGGGGGGGGVESVDSHEGSWRCFGEMDEDELTRRIEGLRPTLPSALFSNPVSNRFDSREPKVEEFHF